MGARTSTGRAVTGVLAPPGRPGGGSLGRQHVPELLGEFEVLRGLPRAGRAERAALGAPAPAQGRPTPAPITTDTVELETEWHRLRLDLDRAREKLHTIQQNARAADLAADAVARQGHEEMVILEPAYLPTRPDRGRGRVFFLGAAIAIFLAFGYAAVRVILDDTLLDEGDVLAIGGPPVLVSVPHLEPPPPPPPPVPFEGRTVDGTRPPLRVP